MNACFQEEPLENTPYLYDTLVRMLSQHAKWLDRRHLKTLAWMMVGVIHAQAISLGAWTPFVVSRAPVPPIRLFLPRGQQ